MDPFVSNCSLEYSVSTTKKWFEPHPLFSQKISTLEGRLRIQLNPPAQLTSQPIQFFIFVRSFFIVHAVEAFLKVECAADYVPNFHPSQFLHE
jgi:hypothetical protein